MQNDTDKAARLQEIGKGAYESIAEMVAALECDYDRLEELHDARKDLKDALEEAERDYDSAEYDGADLEQTEQLGEARDAAEEALATWEGENGEELAALEKAAGECKSREEAEQRISEDPLSIEVRSGWTALGTEMQAEEFCILLSTGGPATRIIGELNEHGEPTRARLQAQDWFTEWTEYLDADSDVLLTYCRQFSFGE